MGVLDLLRSLLGLGDSRDSTGSGRTDVAVERESDGPREGPPGSGDRPEGSSGPETAAEEPEAASTDSVVETSPPDSDEAVDPDGNADTPGDTGAASATDAADTERDGTEDGPDDAGEPRDDEREDDGDPVDTISGIGPAYAERLGNAGVETVPELLAADDVSLAEATDISEKRITRWQERAAE